MAKTGISTKQLQEILDKEFGHPFLEEGTVRTEYFEKSGRLIIRIGRREVELDRKGMVIGGGTIIGMQAL